MIKWKEKKVIQKGSIMKWDLYDLKSTSKKVYILYSTIIYFLFTLIEDNNTMHVSLSTDRQKCINIDVNIV
jgi:hypothetical protein